MRIQHLCELLAHSIPTGVQLTNVTSPLQDLICLRRVIRVRGIEITHIYSHP